MVEHDRAGEMLVDRRRLTDGYRVPDGRCASYRSLYEGPAELDLNQRRRVGSEGAP